MDTSSVSIGAPVLASPQKTDTMKILMIIGAIILIVLLIFAVYLWFKSSSKNDELQKELDLIKKELEYAKANLNTCIESEKPLLQSQIQDLNAKVSAYQALVNNVKNIIADTRTVNSPDEINTYTTALETSLKNLKNTSEILKNASSDETRAINNLIEEYRNFSTIASNLSSYKSLKPLAEGIKTQIENNLLTISGQKVLSSPIVGPMFVQNGNDWTSDTANLSGFINNTKNLANVMGATAGTTFDDLKTNYSGLNSQFNTLNTNYQSLTGDYSILTNTIRDAFAAYTAGEFSGDNINFDFKNDIGTDKYLNMSGSLDRDKLTNLTKYIRSSLYLVGKLNETLNNNSTSARFSDLLNKYNDKLAQCTSYLNTLGRYQYMYNSVNKTARIPKRFLKDTVLFGINIGDNYGQTQDTNLESCKDICNNIDSCVGVYYDMNSNTYEYPSIIGTVSYTVNSPNKDSPVSFYNINNNSQLTNFVITEILSVILTYYPYTATRADDTVVNYEGGVYDLLTSSDPVARKYLTKFVPYNLLGESQIILNNIFKCSHGQWRITIKVIGTTTPTTPYRLMNNIGSQLNNNQIITPTPDFNYTAYVGPVGPVGPTATIPTGFTGIYYKPNNGAIILKPLAINWTNFDPDDSNNTINFQKLLKSCYIMSIPNSTRISMTGTDTYTSMTGTLAYPTVQSPSRGNGIKTGGILFKNIFIPNMNHMYRNSVDAITDTPFYRSNIKEALDDFNGFSLEEANFVNVDNRGTNTETRSRTVDGSTRTLVTRDNCLGICINRTPGNDGKHWTMAVAPPNDAEKLKISRNNNSFTQSLEWDFFLFNDADLSKIDFDF